MSQGLTWGGRDVYLSRDFPWEAGWGVFVGWVLDGTDARVNERKASVCVCHDLENWHRSGEVVQ